MWSFSFFCLLMVAQALGGDIEIEGRIIQGKEAKEGQFPYQVYISFARGDTRKVCGGTIISKKYILTAAHCIDDEFIRDPTKETVRVGSVLRTNGTDIIVDKAVRHPNYSGGSDNDAAILRARSDMAFDKNIKSINLPAKNRALTGAVTVSGWGRTKYDDPAKPINLMYVSVPVVPKNKCEKAYGYITENMFCAGNYEFGGPDSCLGDSGGPAVQDGLVVGITSSGDAKCGAPLKPGIYVNVASPSVRDFISKTTGL